MPSSTFNGQNTWSYEDVAGLSLPAPALVIDVRQFEDQLDFDPMALLVYLSTEVYHIAGEMRQHSMESWGNLHNFLGFRKVNMRDIGTYSIYDPASWQPGKGPEDCPADQLAPLLGELINRLRNQRIEQMRGNDPDQATVRVIFLVDLADQEPEESLTSAQVVGPVSEREGVPSFELAVKCAGLLKAWFAKEQGRISQTDNEMDDWEPRWQRANSHAMVETVAVCLNTRMRKHYHLLTGIDAVRALDMLILVQPYRQDNGHLDIQAQVSHAELILSALLFHWPEAMQSRIEDAPHPRLASLAYSVLPRPIYILGVAAIEHAARWGERWWDYGLETALLDQLLAGEPVEKQERLLHDRVRDWWMNWRGQVQWTLARLKGHLSQLAGLSILERPWEPFSPRIDSFAALKEQVVTFSAWLKPFYSEHGQGSLPELLANAPFLVELGKQISKPSSVEPGEWNRYLEYLSMPEREVRVCLLELFTQARGSIPRALRHLWLLEQRTERLRHDISKCDLSACLDDWQHWWTQASTRLEALERNRPRSGRREKKLVRQERDLLCKSALAIQQKHYVTIYNALEAHYELTLLEQAEFIEPYKKRLKELQLFLEKTQKRSRYLRDVAGLRLALGSQKPLIAPAWPQRSPATLRNRRDQLNQKVLLSHFEHELDALSKEEEPLAFKFLAQASLRFLGPEERVSNGLHDPRPGADRSLNEQQALEHLRVLEILLVGGFLATRAGAQLTRMEPLLTNYRLALQRLQPEPGLLTRTLQEMEETIRSVSLHRKLYSNEMLTNVAWRVPDELPLAALMAGQPRSSELWAVLENTNLLRFLDNASGKATEIVLNLDRQSLLAGFPDGVSGDETCYLYLPPGWESESFENALDQRVRSATQVVRTPNLEKIIYLRIHRVRQFSGDDVPD